MNDCVLCGDDIPRGRAALGYTTCLPCGEQAAKDIRATWTVAPLHKSNYMLITNRDDLAGLNNKGGIIR